MKPKRERRTEVEITLSWGFLIIAGIVAVSCFLGGFLAGLFESCPVKLF